VRDRAKLSEKDAQRISCRESSSNGLFTFLFKVQELLDTNNFTKSRTSTARREREKGTDLQKAQIGEREREKGREIIRATNKHGEQFTISSRLLSEFL
jgi:hypothetical protein